MRYSFTLAAFLPRTLGCVVEANLFSGERTPARTLVLPALRFLERHLRLIDNICGARPRGTRVGCNVYYEPEPRTPVSYIDASSEELLRPPLIQTCSFILIKFTQDILRILAIRGIPALFVEEWC